MCVVIQITTLLLIVCIFFRDATTTESIFNMSLKDCLQAIYRAHALGFFRFNDFNLNEYEHYEVSSTCWSFQK